MRPGAKRAATSSTTPKVTIGPGPTPRPANTMRRPTIRTTRSATENPARRRVIRAPETTIRTKPRTRRPSEDTQSPFTTESRTISRGPRQNRADGLLGQTDRIAIEIHSDFLQPLRRCYSTGGLEPDCEGPPLAATLLQGGFQRIDGRSRASKVASAK